MNFYDAGDEDNFYTRLMGFEQSCMEEADPMFFRASAAPLFAMLGCRSADRCWMLVSECDPQRRVPGGHGRRRRPVPLAPAAATGSGRPRGESNQSAH